MPKKVLINVDSKVGTDLFKWTKKIVLGVTKNKNPNKKRRKKQKKENKENKEVIVEVEETKQKEHRGEGEDFHFHLVDKILEIAVSILDTRNKDPKYI